MTRDARRTLENDPLWYKDAIIYEVHVKAFYDSNNDGIGDFAGLTQRLDYLQDLGINTIWVLPFYPSPMRDDGYDIADYRNIAPEYGTRKDFRTFVREAHRRGLRVITELVINHTSDQHPWFQAARKAPGGSSKRNFYVWSNSDKKWPETRVIFTDTETSNWAWDPVARAYYWHRFFSHQPDLNFNNPQVARAVTRVMRFWLDMGVDGLRLDAIPYLCERTGTNNENLPETHGVIKQMRAVVDQHYKNRMFLAEANQWPEDVRDYFGDGDECHVAYHFPLMPRMYMAVAQEDRHPIVEIMRQTPDIPETCQWAVFLRNHDELTLEMVTDRERDYMYRTYATDPRMRINIGIRRRLAPLMDNDMDKIRLMKSLLLSMPGAPIIYYGDEIGMGDNFYLGDRNGVRTPMQWSPDRNAGFSKADPQRLFLPPIMDPIYGYEAVNVEAQTREPSSLLNWTKRVIAVRKAHKSFGRGTLEFLHPGNRKILAYLREYGDEAMLCVANMSRSAQPVELDLRRFKGRVPVEMMGRTAFPPVGELPYLLTLPGYAFYWFLLTVEAEVPAWHEERLPPFELPVLVLFNGWQSFTTEQPERSRRAMAEKLRAQLENEVLPSFISSQRWFAAKGETIDRFELVAQQEWSSAKKSALLTWVRAHVRDAPAQTYFMPLGLLWGDDDEEQLRAQLYCTLTKVRQRARIGIICDALADEAFCSALVEAIGARQKMPFADGTLRFVPTRAFGKLAGDLSQPLSVRRPHAEGSNSAVILGDRLFLKVYRRMREGVNPEVEMGRFLTEVSPFEHIVPVAGSLEYAGPNGNTITLALLQGFVESQGDGWSYTLAYLERYLDHCLLRGAEAGPDDVEQEHGPFLLMMRTLGERTGELHQALSKASGDPAFEPEPVTPEDLLAWADQVRQEATHTFEALQRRLVDLPEHSRADAEGLLSRQDAVLRYLSERLPEEVSAVKTRYHGDYHLGQVLVAQNDFIIIDFEGEPARSLQERRRKHSALRDVAGMLRSFDYAAHAVMQRLTNDQRARPETLDACALDWKSRTETAFLEGYREAVGGCLCCPADAQHMEALVDLFLVEKGLYELRYEMDNRPDWVGIPIKGILGLLGTP